MLRKATSLARQARPYRSLARQAYDLLEHKVRINTSFADYYRFRFYDSSLSWAEKTLYLGPNGSRYWPFEGNSLKYDSMFATKSIQKSLLMGAGLSTPPMLIKVGASYPINSLKKFRDALAKVDIPILTKFDGGGGGAGIYAFDRTNGSFTHAGEPVDADWIWEKYSARLHRGFLVEQRIENHPDLAALHPESLNTLRLVVVKTIDGRWHFLKPFLKIGRGGSNVDNMSARGLFTGLDANGVAGIAYCKFDDREYEAHPDTDERILGFQVPFYDEALELAIHASKTLGFMETFGWDMAITKDGPTIIEANPGWHFEAIQQRLGPLLTPEIAARLRPRAWYTPWDKTHMYPGYLRKYEGGLWQRLVTANKRFRARRAAGSKHRKT